MKISNGKFFFLLFSILFACCFFQPETKEESAYTRQLKKAFKGSLFDYFSNHNQALDAIEAFIQDGLLEKRPATLIHFDSHSDMYRLSRKDDKNPHIYGQGIESYVNTLILQGTAEEIYWVIPEESRTPENREFFWNPELGPKDEIDYFVMFGGPITQTFYVDESDKELYFDRPGNYQNNPARYRSVRFHKVILDELKLENLDRPVIIDIDADYFSNNGFDTANEMVVRYKERNITRFLSALGELGIRPVLTLGSLSSEYTLEEDKIAVERFFQDIGAVAQGGDYLIGYKHHDRYGDEIHGSNIRRHSNALYRGIYELSYIDLRTTAPDSSTPLNDTSAEYGAAGNRIQKLFGISKGEAAKLLFEWDAEDGDRDSTVQFRQIEQNVQERNR